MSWGVDPSIVVLVLISAALHTGWNVLAKRAGDVMPFTMLMCIGAPLCTAPFAIWLVAGGARPQALSVGMAFVTSLLWVLYYDFLGRSYERGDLSVAYPVIRGVAPAGAAVLGLIAGESLTAAGAAGIALVVVAVFGISRTQAGGPAKLHATWPPVAVGLVSACYSLTDKIGVRGCHPIVYLTMCSGLTAIWLLGLCGVRGWLPRLGRIVRREPWKVLLGAAGNVSSYVLILMAFRVANVAYIVPLRAVAVLFSVAAGGLALGEPAVRGRFGWAAVMLVGITLIALWG